MSIETFPQNIDHEVFRMNWEAYKMPPKTYDSLMINHFNQEISALKDYEGRELYELIQNVEDAESSEIKIQLQGNRLLITNDGDHPFSVEGYGSILRSDQSTKRSEKYIGNKGLGFRSVLNWTNSLSVCSLMAPCSSKGVRCNFSKKIAAEYYKRLKEIWKGLSSDTEALLQEVAYVKRREYPLAILAIPEVEEWNPEKGVTTRIEMKLKPEVIEKVKENIRTLTDSQFFLFLRNLNKIVIEVDNEIKEVECKRTVGSNIVEINVRSRGVTVESQQWIVERLEEGRISVAAARRVDKLSHNVDNHNYYFHSFFPTKIRFGFGCVLHATVELSSNRNNVLRSDGRTFQLLAEAARNLGMSIKEYYKENPTWDAYDIFVTKDRDYQNDEIFSDFFGKMRSLKENESLVPVVGKRYMTSLQTTAITDEFSKFADSLGEYREVFSTVVRPDFENEGIYGNRDFSKHHKMLQEFANQSLSMETRVEYIVMMKRIRWEGLEDERTGYKKLNLFTDKSGNVIYDKAYLLTADQREIPSIVKVKLINDDLRTRLKHQLASEIKMEKVKEESEGRKSNDDRRLYSLLHLIADMGYTDFSYIKDRLFTASKEPHDIEDDIEMVRYLYAQYVLNKSENKMPKDAVLHLLDLSNRPREICNFLYGETQGKWAPMISNHIEEIDYYKESTEKFREFLVKELHMGVNCPMRLIEWVTDNEYLKNFSLNAENCNNKYVRDSLKREGLSPSAFVFDRGYVEMTDPSEIVKDIIADDNAFHAVLNNNEGNFTIYHIPQSRIHQKIVRTPAIFSLNGKLKELSNFIISANKWIGNPLIEIESMTNKEFERFRDLAKAFGAKNDDAELGVAEIYDAINRAGKNDHKTIYQRMKDLLRVKKERGEYIVAPKKLKLWATKADTLLENKIPAEDCYYCDNTPPRAIYERFPILDIGKREGVEIVAEFFGVRPVSEIETKPEIENATHLEIIEKGIKTLLEERAIYIMAVRCDSLRKEKLINSAHKYYTEFRGMNISVWRDLDYTLKIEGEENSDVYKLESSNFLKYDDKYYLSLSESESLTNPSTLSAVASMLCSRFKIQETNWKERFFSILSLPLDNLKYSFTNEYPSDFMDSLKMVLEDKVKIKKTTDLLEFPVILKKILNLEKHRLYEKCLEEGLESQKRFWLQCQDVKNDVTNKIKAIIGNLKVDTDGLEIENIILGDLGISRSSLENLYELKIRDEYKDFLDNITLSNYKLAEYPDILSLSFFPGNMEEIKALWKEHQERRNAEIKELKLLSRQRGDKPLIECAQSDFIIERPISGKGKSGGTRTKGIPSNAEALNVYGKNAEEDVKIYLENKGYKVVSGSSNLDDTKDDGSHYDMIYVDNEDKKHFVEVKYSGTGIVHISAAEYDFAQEMYEKKISYDLFIVYEGKLHIIENAHETLRHYAKPENYKIRIAHK